MILLTPFFMHPCLIKALVGYIQYDKEERRWSQENKLYLHKLGGSSDMWSKWQLRNKPKKKPRL